MRRADNAVEQSTEGAAAGGRCATLCETCRVRAISVCRSMAIDELDELETISTRMKLPAGRVLFDEGDPAEHLFTIHEGAIKLFKMLRDGRRQITGFLLAGDFLGLAFFRTYAYSAETVGDTRLCRFPRERFMALLERHPTLEKELLSRASSELAAAQEQMLLLGRKSARERVASFLLALARRQAASGRASVELVMSRYDIADYLGLTIETVSRAIQAANADGLIRMIDRHHFVVADPGRLAAASASF